MYEEAFLEKPLLVIADLTQSMREDEKAMDCDADVTPESKDLTGPEDEWGSEQTDKAEKETTPGSPILEL